MNIETINNWVCKHHPISSTGLREKAGVTVQGTPIATRLKHLVDKDFATSERAICPVTKKLANVYTSTEKGKRANKSLMNSPKTRIRVESIEAINSRQYEKHPSSTSKSKSSIVKQLMGSKAKGAMGALAELLSAEGEARELLKGTAVRLRHQANIIDEFLNSEIEESPEE